MVNKNFVINKFITVLIAIAVILSCSFAYADNLEVNKTYYFAVTAIDTSGNESVKSNEVYTTVAVGTNKITLSWTAPVANSDGTPLTDLAGYNVYYGTATGNYNKNIATNLTNYAYGAVPDSLSPKEPTNITITCEDVNGAGMQCGTPVVN